MKQCLVASVLKIYIGKYAENETKRSQGRQGTLVVIPRPIILTNFIHAIDIPVSWLTVNLEARPVNNISIFTNMR